MLSYLFMGILISIVLLCLPHGCFQRKAHRIKKVWCCSHSNTKGMVFGLFTHLVCVVGFLLWIFVWGDGDRGWQGLEQVNECALHCWYRLLWNKMCYLDFLGNVL